MDWQWVVLSACMKVVIAFGPTMVRMNEFNLDTHELWLEAKDVGSVASGRIILASLPVTLAINTYSKTETLCIGGVEPFITIVIALILIAAVLAFIKCPTGLLRGTFSPFIVAVLATGFESLYMYVYQDKAAALLCSLALPLVVD